MSSAAIVIVTTSYWEINWEIAFCIIRIIIYICFVVVIMINSNEIDIQLIDFPTNQYGSMVQPDWSRWSVVQLQRYDTAIPAFHSVRRPGYKDNITQICTSSGGEIHCCQRFHMPQAKADMWNIETINLTTARNQQYIFVLLYDQQKLLCFAFTAYWH